MDGVKGKPISVPASDHYAVTLDIEFKNNGGGRVDNGKCLKGEKDDKGKRRRYRSPYVKQ